MTRDLAVLGRGLLSDRLTAPPASGATSLTGRKTAVLCPDHLPPEGQYDGQFPRDRVFVAEDHRLVPLTAHEIDAFLLVLRIGERTVVAVTLHNEVLVPAVAVRIGIVSLEEHVHRIHRPETVAQIVPIHRISVRIHLGPDLFGQFDRCIAVGPHPLLERAVCGV